MTYRSREQPPPLPLPVPFLTVIVWSSRSLRDGAKTPSEVVPGLQREGQAGAPLEGEGDGARGDDTVPAHRLGECQPPMRAI